MSDAKKDLESGSWFADILMKFAPDYVELAGDNPEEMTKNASWKAFVISTAAAIPPGPLGWVTILPEILAVTKLQMNLIYKIAKYYGKDGQLNQTLVMLIFASEAGVEVGKKVFQKVGNKVVIRALSSKMLRPIIQKIGARIGARITQKLFSRWIPFVLAPLFGAFSKMMTTKIGEESIRLFKEDITIVAPITCSKGHEAMPDSKFCPECGEKMNPARD